MSEKIIVNLKPQWEVYRNGNALHLRVSERSRFMTKMYGRFHEDTPPKLIGSGEGFTYEDVKAAGDQCFEDEKLRIELARVRHF